MSLTAGLKARMSAADFHEETARDLHEVADEPWADGADAIIELGLPVQSAVAELPKIQVKSDDGKRVLREDSVEDAILGDDDDNLDPNFDYGVEFTEAELAEAESMAELEADDHLYEDGYTGEPAEAAASPVAEATATLEILDARLVKLADGEILVI